MKAARTAVFVCGYGFDVMPYICNSSICCKNTATACIILLTAKLSNKLQKITFIHAQLKLHLSRLSTRLIHT